VSRNPPKGRDAEGAPAQGTGKFGAKKIPFSHNFKREATSLRERPGKKKNPETEGVGTIEAVSKNLPEGQLKRGKLSRDALRSWPKGRKKNSIADSGGKIVRAREDIFMPTGERPGNTPGAPRGGWRRFHGSPAAEKNSESPSKSTKMSERKNPRGERECGRWNS